MQVVVELPGLVADPQVVGLVAHDVAEDHEVGQQDLVHPPPGLKDVELVLARLGGDVARLVGQLRARRVDVLAAGLEDARDRVLREPVDLQVGVQRAQLARDGDVAPGVAEADGRGDEQRAPAAARSRGARARRRRAAVGARGEVVQQLVEAHRVADVGAVADVDELDELGAGRRRRRRRRGRPGSARRWSPCVTSSGQLTRAIRSSIAARSRPGDSIVSASVSGVVSRAQATESSNCLVECGSV